MGNGAAVVAGSVWIEANDVEVAGLPSGAQHCYLVQRDDDGREYVLRAGASSPLAWFGSDMKVEVNVPIEDSSDARGDDSPADRHSTELAFDNADAAWAIMVKYARQIDRAGYDYNLFGENSNAFVGALIHAAGGDPDTMRPKGVGESEALGYDHWDDIVEDLPPPSDGTLRGTAGADRLVGLQVDDVIKGRAGADTIRAGRGDDRIFGGAGADILAGEDGDDTLFGRGGDDVFVFDTDVSGHDVIRDFADGADRIRFSGAGADGFDDVAVSRFGAYGQHVRVVLGDAWVDLRNVDADLLGADDFDFVTDPFLLA